MSMKCKEIRTGEQEQPRFARVKKHGGGVRILNRDPASFLKIKAHDTKLMKTDGDCIPKSERGLAGGLPFVGRKVLETRRGTNFDGDRAEPPDSSGGSA